MYMPSLQGSETGWRKSSASAGGDCVEVRRISEGFEVRDSKRRTAATLAFTESEWTAFLTGVRAGEFDLSAFS